MHAHVESADRNAGPSETQRQPPAEESRQRLEETATLGVARSPVFLETLTYGRGAPRPLVNGVLRTPDGVVIVRPKAMRGPRKATGLLKLLVRSPPSSAASHQTVAKKVEFLERSNRA